MYAKKLWMAAGISSLLLLGACNNVDDNAQDDTLIDDVENGAERVGDEIETDVNDILDNDNDGAVQNDGHDNGDSINNNGMNNHGNGNNNRGGINNGATINNEPAVENGGTGIAPDDKDR